MCKGDRERWSRTASERMKERGEERRKSKRVMVFERQKDSRGRINRQKHKKRGMKQLKKHERITTETPSEGGVTDSVRL